MSNPRKYRVPPPHKKDIRVLLDDGRVALVGAAWRPLPEVFHSAAVKAGCEVDTNRFSASDVETPARKPPPPPIGSDDAVKAGLVTMLSRDEPEDFNETTGLPNLAVLSKLVGYEVETAQAARVLRALKAEAEAAEKAEGAGGDGDGETDPAADKVAARKAAVKKATAKIARESKPKKSAQSA